MKRGHESIWIFKIGTIITGFWNLILLKKSCWGFIPLNKWSILSLHQLPHGHIFARFMWMIIYGNRQYSSLKMMFMLSSFCISYHYLQNTLSLSGLGKFWFYRLRWRYRYTTHTAFWLDSGADSRDQKNS